MVAVRTFEAQNLVNALCDAGANLDLVNDHDMTALHSVICMLASVESEHQIKSNEALAVTLLNAGARCDVGARFDDRGWEKLRKRGVIGRSLNTRVRGRRRVQPQVGKDANSGEQSVVELKGVEKVVVDTRSKKQRRRDKKKEEEQRNKNGAEESESRTKPRTGRTRSTPQPQHNAVIGIRMRTTRAGSERAESRQGVGKSTE